VVNIVSCTGQKTAEIAAKIQDLTSFPNRMVQQLVEIRELGLSL
jgi:hypothetical protein